MASAAARLLFLAGFQVLVLEREQPLAVRRLVSFAQAVLDRTVEVGGVPGRQVEANDLPAALAGGFVSVLVDPLGRSLARFQLEVLIDARMAKRNLGSARSDARLVVGLGPGFVAGVDVHAVVETQRGPNLGAVIWAGGATADTCIPAQVLGFREERVLRAPCAGRFRGLAKIGALVVAGDVVAEVEGAVVRAGVSGLVRGLLADGVSVDARLKVGDIDPRGPAVDPAHISDKARAVAAGVLEAVLVGLGRG